MPAVQVSELKEAQGINDSLNLSDDEVKKVKFLRSLIEPQISQETVTPEVLSYKRQSAKDWQSVTAKKRRRVIKHPTPMRPQGAEAHPTFVGFRTDHKRTSGAGRALSKESSV